MGLKGQVSYCRLCGERAVAKGYCDKHYRRWHRHGDPGATLRPPDWGSREKHPLWLSWRNAFRMEEGVAPEWLDFWVFVRDVGERPSPTHRLKRKDIHLPFSKENCFWAEQLITDPKILGKKTAYQKEWRRLNPSRAKHHNLKKVYGIGLDEYMELLEKQGGKCAICGNGEFALNQFTGKIRDLAIDHCHTTKRIRGLLCTNCNKGLGHFKDSLEVLDKAIGYLRSHAE